MRRQPGVHDHILLVLLASSLGSSFFLIKIAVHSIMPLYVVFGRLSVGLFFLLTFIFFKKWRLPSIDRFTFWKTVFLLGITMYALPFSLISWAEQEIPSSLAGIYMATVPIFSLIFGHFLTEDEKMSPLKAVGIGVSFLGVAVLLGSSSSGAFTHHLLGQLACLAAASLYAFSSIKTKSLAHISPVIITSTSLLCAVLTMAPFMLFTKSTQVPLVSSLLAVVLLGVLQTALTFLLMNRLIRSVGAVFTTTTNYLVPVFALLWGFFLLKEPISHTILLSLFLIFLGMFLISRGQKT